jgi:hypothetical protein
MTTTLRYKTTQTVMRTYEIEVGGLADAFACGVSSAGIGQVVLESSDDERIMPDTIHEYDPERGDD